MFFSNLPIADFEQANASWEMFSYELSHSKLFLVKNIILLLLNFHSIKINLLNNFSHSEDF